METTNGIAAVLQQLITDLREIAGGEFTTGVAGVEEQIGPFLLQGRYLASSLSESPGRSLLPPPEGGRDAS